MQLKIVSALLFSTVALGFDLGDSVDSVASKVEGAVSNGAGDVTSIAAEATGKVGDLVSSAISAGHTNAAQLSSEVYAASSAFMSGFSSGASSAGVTSTPTTQATTLTNSAGSATGTSTITSEVSVPTSSESASASSSSSDGAGAMPTAPGLGYGVAGVAGVLGVMAAL